MIYLEDSIDWNAITTIDTWLDANVGVMYAGESLAVDLLRITKVCEEAGEAIEAFIGATGGNPRKGFSHEMKDVVGELADVVCTGILAIQHFTKDTGETRMIIKDKIRSISRRVV